MTTSVWEIVTTAISGLGVPYAADRLLVDDGENYPATYIVYFLVSAPPEQYADDAEELRSYTIQVNVFSVNGLINLPDVDTAMTTAGFIKGRMFEIPPDSETSHYGLGTEYIYSM